MNENFQAALQDDALAMLGEEAELSERMRYVPRDERPRRWVYGVVDRDAHTEPPGMIRAGRRRLVIEIRNHATRGVVPDELDTGDKIELKVNGKDWETRTISTKDQNGEALVTWDNATVRITLV